MSDPARKVERMKVGLVGVLRDVPLTTLALAIGFGLALIQTAQGLATFVEGVTQHGSGAHEIRFEFGPSLNWFVGGHLFAFGQLVQGLIELAVVALAAVLVRRLTRPTELLADEG
jgi:hypothetical protein